MSKIFKPRRGLKATAIKKSIVLEKGELFFEVPEGGVGTGLARVKLGDGVHKYDELPYSINLDEINDIRLVFNASSTADNTALLNEIVTGKSLGNLIGSIKTLLSNLVKSDTTNTKKLEDVTDKAAPKKHSSSTIDYGVGSFSQYGHLKISSSVDDVSEIDKDVAASMFSVRELYNALITRHIETDILLESGEVLITETDTSTGSETSILGEVNL
jgi:hypothetical protein